MIIQSFSFTNFFSFKEWFEASLVMNGKGPKDISLDGNYSSVLCIKGANASGKTNVLKALHFVTDFCTNSFKRSPNDKIPISPFYENEKHSEFSIDFIVEDIKYRYILFTTKDRIIKEQLFRKKDRLTIIIERKNNEFTKIIEEFAELKKMKLKNNASFISTAFQYEFNSIFKIYDFFDNCYTNVTQFGLMDAKPDVGKVSAIYYKNEQMFDFVKSIILKCDTGIKDIKINKYNNDAGEEIYFPSFSHDHSNGTGINISFDESSGTMFLFRYLYLYFIVLKKGGLLIMDELDTNLHPHILPLLINLFLDKTINEKNAQLIFTTHNAEIMDILGKYRTILINKEDNESFGYRLDEIGGTLIRQNRPISPLYNKRKIGGTPTL